MVGWYSRAPRLVRPVASSLVPPTKPMSPAQVLGSGWGPRGLPNGSVGRRVTVWLASVVIWALLVPCGSATW
ncbi:hypothetical protein UK12_16690 [Saccharothrix sp. ST-888]|nr:hypothetical protein UK12_16690 [Saccharothrix sp. ST-888]